MSGTDGRFILLHSTCSRSVNSGTEQCDTNFHVKLSKESLMHGSPKENDLHTCEAVPWLWTGLLSGVWLHPLVPRSQAGGKAAK